MKKVVNLCVAIFTLLAVASCGGAKSFGKMENGLGGATASVSYTCAPEVLVLNNGVVSAAVTINFPAEYFNKVSIMRVTPVIVFEGGEIAGKEFFFQGAEVADNYTAVSAQGGSFTENLEFPYSEQMELCELQLRFELKNAKKAENPFYFVNANTGLLLSKDEDTLIAGSSAEAAALRVACGAKVAKGVNTLQNDFKFAALMDGMANNYKAVTYDVSKANVKYNVSSSRVAKDALTDAQMVAFKEVVEATQANTYASQSISASGYASPDGPVKFNDKLSKARSESAMKAMQKFFDQMGVTADVAAYGEDWDGFKELVSASSIQDKNLILQVLSLYESAVEREAEIKNLSSVYTELKTDILPELRRTQIISNISINGYSDTEMMVFVAEKKYAELTQEEILYLCDKVIEDNETKKDILSYASKKFNDARAYNNLGVVLAKMGEAAASLEAFQMATRNGASDATINKNLLLANLDNNNYAEAKKYSGDAKASAALAAMGGDYAPATKSFEGYNAAVANIMVGNYAAAKSALAKCKCAASDYLRGVIAAGEGDVQGGIAYIKKAIEAAPELAQKAKKDVNLANLVEGGLTL